MLEKIRNNTVLISSVLIFYGAVKQIYYYRAFNIPILKYLTLSEILTSTFNDIVIIVTFSVIVFVLTFLMILIFSRTSKLSNEETVEVLDRSVEKNIKLKVVAFFILFLMCFAAIYCSIIYTSYTATLALCFLFTQAISYFFRWQKLDIIEKIKNTSYELIIILIGNTVICIFCFSKMEISETRRQKVVTRIVTHDTLICSQSNHLLFLGKTENFLFTYDDSTRASMVIPMSEVKLIEQK